MPGLHRTTLPNAPAPDDTARASCLASALSRRGFVCAALAPAVAAALAACADEVAAGPDGGEPTPGVAVAGSVVTIELARQPALLTPNGFLVVPDAGAKVAVVNVGGSFRAFTSTCTHQGCDVTRFWGGTIVCDCHGSRFDVNGNVVEAAAGSGLTPQTQPPLHAYPTSYDAAAQRLTITKI